MTHAEHSPWIVETSDDTFEKDVIERSKEKPVVLDFWATWCQPCLMLKPLLEQLADEYQGQFVLVKAEQQATPKALAEFRIEAYPTVFGLVDGQPVDFFMGLLRPQQLRQWIDRLIESAEVAKAGKLENTDPGAAEAEYREALEGSPKDDRLLVGLARVLLKQDKREECKEIIDRLEERGYLEPEAEKIKAALDLAAKEGANVGELRKMVGANPNDYAARVSLAEALAAQGEYEQSLELCLGAVEEDRAGAGETARKLMVEIFQVLPADSPLRGKYQRKLSAALY